MDSECVNLPDETFFPEVGREENLDAHFRVVQEALKAIGRVRSWITRRIGIVIVRVAVVRSGIGVGCYIYDRPRNLLQQAHIYAELSNVIVVRGELIRSIRLANDVPNMLDALLGCRPRTTIFEIDASLTEAIRGCLVPVCPMGISRRCSAEGMNVRIINIFPHILEFLPDLPPHLGPFGCNLYRLRGYALFLLLFLLLCAIRSMLHV